MSLLLCIERRKLRNARDMTPPGLGSSYRSNITAQRYKRIAEEFWVSAEAPTTEEGDLMSEVESWLETEFPKVAADLKFELREVLAPKTTLWKRIWRIIAGVFEVALVGLRTSPSRRWRLPQRDG